MNHSALWYFEHFGLLHGLSDEQKQVVKQHARMFNVKRGQPVYLPGDPSEHVYLVKTGAVKIVGNAPEGCEVILALLTPGDIFPIELLGLIAIVEPPEDFCEQQLPDVRESLLLAGGDRRLHLGAIVVHDGIPESFHA